MKTLLVTWKQNLKHLSKDEYLLLREMCHLSKNVYNESLYNIRQHYFAEGVFLNYEANYPIEKNSENYKLLGANIAQQTMKCVDATFRSFFALLKLVEKNSIREMLSVYLIICPKTGFIRFTSLHNKFH